MTTRMLPLGGLTQQGVAGPTVGNAPQGNARRPYSATSGGYIDALGDPSGDASTLNSQGFLLVGESGTTAQRPNGAGRCVPGTLYVDTAISKLIIWDGANWRDPVTGSTA